MVHYDIPDPYNKGSRYYTNHYVCLWEVTGAEVINHYEWNDLIENKNWYEEVIMPAFDRFNGNQRPNSDALHAPAFDMLTMIENLPIADGPISPSIDSVEDSDRDLEHELLDHAPDSDSDNED
ncbi:hypothetical protein C7974DRAFT_438426 [Boeremia exigua]|uniref:uncharacterized protein n=1 Tax=Boeremia exigua TaxID=749465 RepID=UPI001E8ECABD|nr:uncharacterized protein C7974DRAFT_438426 [Boeremia exigua]KAH6643531.1 hypothetical protein C7974DRAFT_438426 [Boeremia exigua]